MAALAKFKRLARLCGWLWLGLTAMIIAACGALFASACKHTGIGGKQDTGTDTSATLLPDAGPPARPDAARDGDTAPSVDSHKDDLWNVPCE